MKQLFMDIFRRLASIGADPKDDAESRLPKTLLVVSSIAFMIAGLAWGVMYIAFGETHAGMIPFGYGVFSFFSLVYFGVA